MVTQGRSGLGASGSISFLEFIHGRNNVLWVFIKLNATKAPGEGDGHTCKVLEANNNFLKGFSI